MTITRIVRAVSGPLAACTLLSACGEGDGRPRRSGESNGDSSRVSGGAAAAAPIVFQLTGLMLVVPPDASTRDADILLPKEPVGEPHVAWLGFGVQGDEAYLDRLCAVDDAVKGRPAKDAGICYVNLDRWSLDPFGGGGMPETEPERLPPGVLNATRISGKEHKVNLSWLDNDVRSQVIFRTGKAEATDCTLATWQYRDPDEGDPRIPLLNVLNWKVRGVERPELVFRLKANPNSTVRARLPEPDGTGNISLILAHIPVDDRRYLPPITVRPTLGTPPARAAHFDVFYDLLRKPGTPPEPVPGGSRHVPLEGRKARDEACDLGITRQGGRFLQGRSMATYACMVASGERGS